ncbi:MAG TPA: hypothetical protein ENN46_02925 [Candidatus Woesearchaeota archaeon]|nr:hypothetical protein [Candidatus Woesearchaeota archaeon]
MEIENAIGQRVSVRDYLDKPIEREMLGKILESGRLAPSSGNLQPLFFIVVQDKEKREKLAVACLEQYWMAKAPVHIVIVSDTEKCKQYYGIRGERLYSIQNAAVAAENMLLMATSLGLGSCFVSAFNEDQVSRELAIREEYRPQAIITLGYARTSKRTEKASLYKLTFLEVFGNRVENADVMMRNFNFIGKAVEKSKGVLEKAKDRIKLSVEPILKKKEKKKEEEKEPEKA